MFVRPSVGVVVQALLDPEVAGVMFTRNPINGADERMIEASWGLGEAVVAGLVIPDSYCGGGHGDGRARRPGVERIAAPRPPARGAGGGAGGPQAPGPLRPRAPP